MNAGLILRADEEKPCHVAFLGDELETHTVKTNQEIVELVEEHEPEIVAVNAGEAEDKELTEGEEDLKEEGFQFKPASHEPVKNRRLEALKNTIKHKMGAEKPEFIRYDPNITSKNLNLHSDDSLEGFGIETSTIGSAGEFDAVLGAITSRFYQQNQYRDLGMVVPESMED